MHCFRLPYFWTNWPNTHRQSSISDHSLSDSSSGATSHGPCEGLNISQSHRKIQGEVRDQGTSSNTGVDRDKY